MTKVSLIHDVQSCTICEPDLPYGARPVFQAHPKAKILIAGQAPGRRVHETGIPFNDPSGDRLREWMGIDKETFYNAEKVAILPMGLCYPGTGKSGDLPPRKECAAAWRERLLAYIPDIQLTLLIGEYAQKWHLGEAYKGQVTATVQACQEYAPQYIPLPHPSPRNNIWLKKNLWFERETLPVLKKRVYQSLI